MSEPILRVEGLRKSYRRGLLRPRETFRLEADFSVPEPTVVGVMGPNGYGKTTLFDLITGYNLPSAGRVLCNGRNVHDVRYDDSDRLAIPYHQPSQDTGRATCRESGSQH